MLSQEGPKIKPGYISFLSQHQCPFKLGCMQQSPLQRSSRLTWTGIKYWTSISDVRFSPGTFYYQVASHKVVNLKNILLNHTRHWVRELGNQYYPLGQNLRCAIAKFITMHWIWFLGITPAKWSYLKQMDLQAMTMMGGLMWKMWKRKFGKSWVHGSDHHTHLFPVNNSRLV